MKLRMVRAGAGRWLSTDVIAEMHWFDKNMDRSDTIPTSLNGMTVVVVTKRQERIQLTGTDLSLFLDGLWGTV